VEVGKPLLSGFDDAAGINTDKVRSKKARGILRDPCVKPLVFNAKNGCGGVMALRWG
jgi:hypothetical protein